MINFIETLFGVAIAAAVAALVLWARRRRPTARRLGAVALACTAVGAALELYVRARG